MQIPLKVWSYISGAVMAGTPNKRMECVSMPTIGKFQTPASIAKMLRPAATKPQGRKVWSIDLETVWVPFFTASNTVGDTDIPRDALGAPLRLSKDKDGTIRFKEDGRPQLKVAKELSKAVGDVRQNIVAELMAFPQMVYKAKPDQYKAELDANYNAGQPIIEKSNREMAEAQKAQLEKVMAEATETPTELPTEMPITEPEGELVAA